MDWGLPSKWCTIAITSVTLSISVAYYFKCVYLKKSEEPTVEMAAAAELDQSSPVSGIISSMEQMSVGKPCTEAPEEVELPDRDSANHSPSDFLSGNHNSDAHSESSNDSGKGGSDCANPNGENVRFDVVTPPLSPAHAVVPLPERLFVYEFEIPQALCGLLIGRFGAYVTQIKNTTGASLFIKEHTRRNRHQICAIEGTKNEIDSALAQIRAKLPLKKYPHLTLEQINVPQSTAVPVLPDSIQLHLPPEVSCDVIISAVVAPNHIFVQQITHPTYSSLARLDYCMIQCYNELDTPGLPQPIQPNMICAAPSMEGWFRAKVLAVYPPSATAVTNAEEQEVPENEVASSDAVGEVKTEMTGETSHTDFEVDICFVDYGGYSRVPASSLRQIRADFMTLPFQAVECLLANVAPLSEEGWSDESYAEMENLTSERMLQVQAVSCSLEGLPLVYLYQMSAVGPHLINRQLVESGVALWVEPQLISN